MPTLYQILLEWYEVAEETVAWEMWHIRWPLKCKHKGMLPRRRCVGDIKICWQFFKHYSANACVSHVVSHLQFFQKLCVQSW
jgi:hypothetical protein